MIKANVGYFHQHSFVAGLDLDFPVRAARQTLDNHVPLEGRP